MTRSTTPMAPLTAGRLMPPAPTKLSSTHCLAKSFLVNEEIKNKNLRKNRNDVQS